MVAVLAFDAVAVLVVVDLVALLLGQVGTLEDFFERSGELVWNG